MRQSSSVLVYALYLKHAYTTYCTLLGSTHWVSGQALQRNDKVFVGAALSSIRLGMELRLSTLQLLWEPRHTFDEVSAARALVK